MLCKPESFVQVKGLQQIKKFEEAEICLYSLEVNSTMSYFIVCRSLTLAKSSTYFEIEQDWNLIIENYYKNVKKVGANKFSLQFLKSLYREVWRESVVIPQMRDEDLIEDQEEKDSTNPDLSHIISLIQKNEQKAKIVRAIKDNCPSIWTDTDPLGHTILHKAVISGRGDLFEMMVNKGRNFINYEQKDNEGKTLFHWAAEIAHYKMCEILLQKNVPIMTLSNDGLMPVHYLVRVNRSEENAEISNFRRIFLLILQSGFDINSCDHFGNSVLHFAAQYSSVPIVKCVLEEDCDIDLKNNEGESALHVACRRGALDIVKLLLNYGASYSIVGRHGNAKKVAIAHKHASVLAVISDKEVEDNKNVVVRDVRTMNIIDKKPLPSTPLSLEDGKQHDFIIVHNNLTGPYQCQYCFLPIIVPMASSCVECEYTVHQGSCARAAFYLVPCDTPLPPIVLDLSTELPLPLYPILSEEEKNEPLDPPSLPSSPSTSTLLSNMSFMVSSVADLFNCYMADFLSPEKSIQDVFGTIFEEKELHFLYLQFVRSCERGSNVLSKRQIADCLGYTLNFDGITNVIALLFEKASDTPLDFTSYIRTLSILLRGQEEEQLHLIFKVMDEGGKGYLVQHDYRQIVEAIQLSLAKMHLSISFDGGRFLSELFARLHAEDGRVSFEKFMQHMPSHKVYTQSLGLLPSLPPYSEYSPSRGMAIIFGHERWDLAIHLMMGIRQSTSEVSALHDRSLRSKDFLDTVTLSYTSPRKGYEKKWEFIDYGRRAFRKLREFYGISQPSYQFSMGPERILGNLLLGQFSALLDVVSTGRSGSFFFKSMDSNYLIKTLPPEEHSFLLRILPDYVTYQLQHQNSLLPRILGVHSLKANLEIYNFIVMGNVFASHFAIDEQYDLKGSKVNRLVEVDQITPQIALKDLNFNKILKLGFKNKALFLEQLERDCKFLEERNICDYSLLVGIHYLKEGEMQCFEDYQPSDPSIFRNRFNGLLSSDKKELYFFGIIDVLTVYNLSKFSERTLKSIIHYNERMYISAMSPLPYRLRFQKYISSILT